MTIFNTCLIALLTVLLVACGQRGPLYLPSAQQTAAAKKHAEKQPATKNSSQSEEDPITQLLGK